MNKPLKQPVPSTFASRTRKPSLIWAFLMVGCLVFHLASKATVAMEEPQYLQNPNFVINAVRDYSSSVPIGLQEVPYSFSPVGQPDLRLRLEEEGYCLTQDVNWRNLFSFKKIEGDNKYKCDPESCSFFGQVGESWQFDQNNLPRNQNQFQIMVNQGDNQLSFFIEEQNKISLKKITKGENSKIIIWQLQPDYICKNLNPVETDPSSLLFKVTPKGHIIKYLFSKTQIEAMYFLHSQHQSSRKLKAEYVDREHKIVFCSTPDLPYVRGLNLASEDFPLKVYNIKNFFRGLGDNAANAKNNSTIRNEDDITVKQGQVLYLAPSYDTLLPMLGDVEITLGDSGYLYGATYNNLRIKLRELIQLKNERGIRYPTFVVRYSDDGMKFISISWLSLGVASIAAQESIGNVTQLGEAVILNSLKKFHVITRDLGKDLNTATNTLGQSLESSSQNINRAINSFSQAMLTSSENFSDTAKFCTKNFGETILFSAYTFENTIRFLATTAQASVAETNANLKEISYTMVKSLGHTMDSLDLTLKGVATTLGKSAEQSSQNIREGLDTASKHFKDAFKDVSNAVESSAGDISKALEGASDNFVKGMTSVEKAAAEMKNINVNLGCVIF